MSNSWGRTVWGLGVLACAAVGRSDAQAVTAVRVADDVLCAACAITARTTSVLTLPRDTTDGFPVRVTVDSRGRYFVFRRADVPLVFDSQGRLLQALGRRGLGLGDFFMAYDGLLIGRDSILILDAIGQRGTVVDSSLVPVGFATIPFKLSSPVVLAWPNAVIARGVPTPAAAAFTPMRSRNSGPDRSARGTES